MLRKKELIIILITGILCVSCAWAEEQKVRTVRMRDPKTGKVVTKQVPVTPQEGDTYKNTSVLVEAFMVHVSADALVEAGVSPIGQSPEGVSILKILWCLKDEENAKVISGAKVNCRHRQEAETNSHQRRYVARKRVTTRKGPDGPVQSENISYDDYQSGLKFQSRAFVLEKNNVSVEYIFSMTDFDEVEDQTAPPTTYSQEWQGTLTAISGRPVIAGAAQDDESITFLILTATIQEEEKD